LTEIIRGRHFWPYKGMQQIVWRHIFIISSCFTLGVSFHAQQRGCVCYLTKYILFYIGMFVTWRNLRFCHVYSSSRLYVCLFVCIFVLYRSQFTFNCYHLGHIRSWLKYGEIVEGDKPKVKGQGHNWYRVTNYINWYNFWTKRAREMGPSALESLNSGLPVVCGPCCSKTSRFSAKWRQRKVPIVIFESWCPLSDLD